MSLAMIKSLALWSIEEAEFLNKENSKGDNKASCWTLEVGKNKVEKAPKTETKSDQSIS